VTRAAGHNRLIAPLRGYTLILTEILQMNPKPASMFAFSRPSCKIQLIPTRSPTVYLGGTDRSRIGRQYPTVFSAVELTRFV